MQNNLSRNLRSLRVKSGITQSEFCEMIQNSDSKGRTLNTTTYQNHEYGKTEPPILYLQLYANHYEISIDDLINLKLPS